MNRRLLLQSLAAIPLSVAAGQLWAAPAAGSRLLVVFLRGAYDACNLLVPLSSSFYEEVRPDIAVPRPGTAPDSALALSADWGLHPALQSSLYPLYQKGELAFVPFAGTDDTSRSHFETQDSIELGQPQGASRDYRSGFMNRLASVMQGAVPISFTSQLPLVMKGAVQIPNAALKAVTRTSLGSRQSELIASMYKGTPLASPVNEGFSVRDEVMRELNTEMDAASRQAMSAKGFGGEARRIARLMRDRYNLGFVDVGGWDTHVNQGGAKGYLANRLNELGNGLAAFADEMGVAWKNTTVVVVSEFGRTVRQNSNRGTDHGHGTVYWVLGGSVRGQRMAGEQVRLDAATLFENRDLPVLNEYRALLGGLFARQFGLNKAQLDQVFSGVSSRDLGLI